MQKFEYTATNDSGDVIISGAQASEVAEILGVSVSHVRRFANTGRKCCRLYIITRTDIEIENDINDSNPKKASLLDKWDECMYGIRKRYGLDLSHWNEFFERQVDTHENVI